MSQTVAAPLDVDWVRSRFPALRSDWTLMDNAGGAAPLDAVVERIADYLRRWPVQLGASYAPSMEAGRRQAEAREALAGLFATGGGPAPAPGQVAIGASTTSLLSRLARSLAPTLSAGDEIIVTDVDHEANIGPWLRLQAQGVVIRWWRIRGDSMQLELEDLDALLTARTRLVCFTHASNLLGSAVDIRAVASRAHAAGARCCVDGVAYAPHRALAFAEWGVDWYVFSLYKVFGPHCAVLCSSPGGAAMLANLNHEWMQPADAAGRLEAGAYPYELAWGAAAVPAYLDALGAHQGGAAFAAIEAHERALTARLLDWLATRGGTRIIGARTAGPERLPTVSFVTPRATPAAVVAHTDKAKIGIRHGHFYAPRLVEALGLARNAGVVRVSLAHYNTLEEVERLVAALEVIL